MQGACIFCSLCTTILSQTTQDSPTEQKPIENMSIIKLILPGKTVTPAGLF